MKGIWGNALYHFFNFSVNLKPHNKKFILKMRNIFQSYNFMECLSARQCAYHSRGYSVQDTFTVPVLKELSSSWGIRYLVHSGT